MCYWCTMYACNCDGGVTEKQWRDAVTQVCKREPGLSEKDLTSEAWVVLGKHPNCGHCGAHLKDLTRKIIKITPI